MIEHNARSKCHTWIDIEHVRKSGYLVQLHVIRFKIGNVSIHSVQRTFTSFLIAPERVYIIVRTINRVEMTIVFLE